ncbi:hypothetical protein L917_00124, partial [Phytophthora nicotianae]
ARHLANSSSYSRKRKLPFHDGPRGGYKGHPRATRESIALFLAESSRNGQLTRGAAVAAAVKFGCCPLWALTIFKERYNSQSKARSGRSPYPPSWLRALYASRTLRTVDAKC